MDLEEKPSLGCDGDEDKEEENEEESDNQNLDESTQFEVTDNVSNTDGSLYKSQLSTTVMEVLDERNKRIENLERQVYHQRLQLEFYLHQALCSPKVISLARYCKPSTLDSNIHLNLAMTNYCRESGTRTRMSELYERMLHIDEKISETVEVQHQMVCDVIDQLYGAGGGNCAKKLLKCYFERDSNFETLAQILGGTCELKKELDMFRTCCNSLISVEAERNVLVEQVYSTPTPQRVNYNFLLTMHCEKARLEDELNEIKEQQQQIQNRLHCGYRISLDKTDVKSAYQPSRELLATMLQSVNYDVKTLVEATEDHKSRHKAEIRNLHNENCELTHQVNALKMVHEHNENLSLRLMLLQQKFEETTKELVRLKNQHAIERQQQIAELMVQLKGAQLQVGCMREKFSQYEFLQQEAKELREKLDNLKNLQDERDYYKAQASDLQAVEAAYAQAIKHSPPNVRSRGDCTDGSFLEDFQDKTRRLQVAKMECETLRGEIDVLKKHSDEQEEQIQRLLQVVKKITSCNDLQAKSMDSRLSNKLFDNAAPSATSIYNYITTKSNLNETPRKSFNVFQSTVHKTLLGGCSVEVDSGYNSIPSHSSVESKLRPKLSPVVSQDLTDNRKQSCNGMAPATSLAGSTACDVTRIPSIKSKASSSVKHDLDPAVSQSSRSTKTKMSTTSQHELVSELSPAVSRTSSSVLKPVTSIKTKQSLSSQRSRSSRTMDELELPPTQTALDPSSSSSSNRSEIREDSFNPVVPQAMPLDQHSTGNAYESTTSRLQRSRSLSPGTTKAKVQVRPVTPAILQRVTEQPSGLHVEVEWKEPSGLVTTPPQSSSLHVEEKREGLSKAGSQVNDNEVKASTILGKASKQKLASKLPVSIKSSTRSSSLRSPPAIPSCSKSSRTAVPSPTGSSSSRKSATTLPKRVHKPPILDCLSTHSKVITVESNTSQGATNSAAKRKPVVVKTIKTISESGKRPLLATTVQVHSARSSDSEILKALIESSLPVSGVIRMKNSKSLALKVRYTPTGDQRQAVEAITDLQPSTSEDEDEEDPSCRTAERQTHSPGTDGQSSSSVENPTDSSRSSSISNTIAQQNCCDLLTERRERANESCVGLEKEDEVNIKPTCYGTNKNRSRATRFSATTISTGNVSSRSEDRKRKGTEQAGDEESSPQDQGDLEIVPSKQTQMQKFEEYCKAASSQEWKESASYLNETGTPDYLSCLSVFPNSSKDLKQVATYLNLADAYGKAETAKDDEGKTKRLRNQLKDITTELEEKLKQPGGRESLIGSLKTINEALSKNS